MILEKTLDNGLELIINKTNTPVVSVQVWVDVGSIDEKPQEAGWCHFLEHMLFKGTSKRTTAQIAGSIEGAGGEMNAFTSFEYTAYHITLSNERWKFANEILADMVLNSAFKPSEFAPEKEVILEEIKRGEDSPERQLYHGMYRMQWGAVGYGRPVIGYPKTVAACTAAKLKAFWKKWYAPSLMTVVVCGDVDVKDTIATIEKTWGKAKGKALRKKRRETGFDTSFVKGKTHESKHFPVNSIRWIGTIPAVSLSDERLPALDVAATVLGQGETSRLHQRIFREEHLVTSIGAGLWAPLSEGFLSFDADIPVEKHGIFRKALKEELERFAEEGPTAEELERAKVGLESDRIYSSQTMDGLAHRYGYLNTSVGHVQFDLNYLAQIRDLTREDVRVEFKKLLHSKPMREFALFPKNYEAKNFWNGDLQVINEAPAAPKAAVKKSKEESAGKLVTLPNGIDLVLFERHDVPTVSVQAAVLGGLRAEDQKTSGIGSLLASVWDKGPTGWSAEKTARFLEGKASRISAFSGKNSTGLSLTTLTHYLEDTMPLYFDMLFDPALSESEFRREKIVQLEDLKTFDDRPSRLADKLFNEAMFEGHPYSRPTVGTIESVESLTAKNLQEHYSRLLKSGRLVVSVSGKFSSDQVIKALHKYQHSGGKNSLSDKLPVAPVKAPRYAEVQKNREQSHLLYGFRGLTIDDKDRHNMKVMSTLLSGQSGRLFRELRDKQGLCYVVAPMNFEGLETGYFAVYMGTDPRKREQALKGIASELQRLVDKPLAESDVKRAKEFLSGRHHMDLQLNSSICSTAALNQLYGLGYDNHLRLEEELKTVSAASIRKLAQRLFTQPTVTAVVV